MVTGCGNRSIEFIDVGGQIPTRRRNGSLEGRHEEVISLLDAISMVVVVVTII